MTDARQQEPRAPDVWEEHAELYVRTLGAACAWPVHPLLDAVQVGPGTRVLDVGTGPGTVAAAAADRGAAVTAVDSSPAMARLARAAAPSARTLVAALPRPVLPPGVRGQSQRVPCAARRGARLRGLTPRRRRPATQRLNRLFRRPVRELDGLTGAGSR
ncbi:methyltransferase domain-containing protein [Streptomyces sp. NPDC051704]|uniref:methyltransferase domain-containing protein n=1 Tax=Streptomyces sp. NPDC051704 TaxID=3365671 RepID=UPI0037AFFB4C